MVKETDRAAICLWCGKVIKVKENGTLCSHKASGGKCEGSNKKLEAEIPEPKK